MASLWFEQLSVLRSHLHGVDDELVASIEMRTTIFEQVARPNVSPRAEDRRASDCKRWLFASDKFWQHCESEES